MDTIFIDQIKVKTTLGVPAWERLLPQTVMLDIEMSFDLKPAGRSDAIGDTIDYGAVVGRIQQSAAETSFQLVEALAEHIAQLILQEFGALSVKIKVAKPNILAGVKALGVIIERP